MSELPQQDGLINLNNEIIDFWNQLQINQKQDLINALPEACRRECSIARLVIARVVEEGSEIEHAHERLGECSGLPHTVGTCGATKRVCSHSGSGDTESFSEQINYLYDYIQKKVSVILATD